MSRSLALAAALAALLVIALGSTAGARPAARSARACALPKYPGLGYFTSLEVTHVSCATGKRVTLAHYRCRTRHGRKGRCSSVLGYRCTERRNANSIEYNARVTCKRGSKKVVYTYQQHLV
jgi:hypothetical protein